MPRSKRRKRGTSPHPGVVLINRKDRGWIARCDDPISGKRQDVSLNPLGITSKGARMSWAQSKSRDIKQLKAAIAAAGEVEEGAPKTIQESLAVWIEQSEARLAPRTVKAYRETEGLLNTWGGNIELRNLRSSTMAEFGRQLPLFS